MNEKLSLIEEISVRCNKCGKAIKTTHPFIVNHKTDPKLTENILEREFWLLKCCHCNHEAHVPIFFIFHDPATNFIAMVVDYLDSAFNGYLQKKSQGKLLLEKYKKILSDNDNKFNNLNENDLKVIPYDFLKMKYSNKPVRNIGYFFFCPLPKFISFETEGEREKTDEYMLNILHNNYSNRIKLLVDFIAHDFDFSESYLPRQSEKYKGPIGTYGVSDILLYVSSTIILPIVLGVIANQLSKIIFDRPKKEYSGKEKAKYYFEKNTIASLKKQFSLSDELSIIIFDESLNKAIRLNGNIEKIIQEAHEVGMSLLLDLYIPGNCHVVSFVNDYFIDPSIDDNLNHISDLSTFYKRHFASDTRILYIHDIKLTNDQRKVSEAAKELIIHKKYNEALDILLSIDTTDKPLLIEYAYNLGICYRGLNEYSKACSFFYFVLHNLICAPSIETASKIITYPNSINEKDKKLLSENAKTIRALESDIFDKMSNTTEPKLLAEIENIMKNENISYREKVEEIKRILTN